MLIGEGKGGTVICFRFCVFLKNFGLMRKSSGRAGSNESLAKSCSLISYLSICNPSNAIEDVLRKYLHLMQIKIGYCSFIEMAVEKAREGWSFYCWLYIHFNQFQNWFVTLYLCVNMCLVTFANIIILWILIASRKTCLQKRDVWLQRWLMPASDHSRICVKEMLLQWVANVLEKNVLHFYKTTTLSTF